MRPCIVISLLMLLPVENCGQNGSTITLYNQKNLPTNLTYIGQVQDVCRWADIDGEHITLTAETGEFPSISEQYDGYRDAELYAYDYLVHNDTFEQSWKVYDYIKGCPVDIEIGFVNGTFQITDLNKDGRGEVWIMYQVACHGDISPPVMKVVMYEGQQKFAMRGRGRVKLSAYESGYEGGEYAFDRAFLNGPDEFRAFAKQLWRDNIDTKAK